MKVLQILKYLVNFSLVVFLVTAFFSVLHPFTDSFYTGVEMEKYLWVQVTYIAVHLGVIFMILYYLRRFIVNSANGKSLDKLTRKYLRMAGIFCLLYGIIKIPQLSAFLSFYFNYTSSDSSILSAGFMEVGSLCFTFLIGLFFIYLSKVLELSDMIEKENRLTI